MCLWSEWYVACINSKFNKIFQQNADSVVWCEWSECLDCLTLDYRQFTPDKLTFMLLLLHFDLSQIFIGFLLVTGDLILFLHQRLWKSTSPTFKSCFSTLLLFSLVLCIAFHALSLNPRCISISSRWVALNDFHSVFQSTVPTLGLTSSCLS